MRKSATLAISAVIAVGLDGCAGETPGTLPASQAALAATDTRSIEYSGTGRWFQFGQAANPTLPWPAFDLKSFSAGIDYEAPAAQVQMERIQVVEPNRARPTPVAQRVVQIVSGTHAWNMTAPAGAVPGDGDLTWPADPVHLIEGVVNEFFEDEPADQLSNDASTLR